MKTTDNKKKITLTKKLEKDHHTPAGVGLTLSNRNSSSLSKENNLRHPRMLKPKKSNARSKDEKNLSLSKDYQSLNKNGSSKDLLQYQS